MRIVIVGRGRVGHGLAQALRTSALETVSVAGRQLDVAGLQGADAIVLAVPDSAIAACAAHIADARLDETVVLHCAGARSADDLAACAHAGHATGVMHPLASFPEPPNTVDLREVTFVISGAPPAIAAAEHIARAVGAVPVTAPVQGPAYHALAALVANGAPALANAAVPALESLGLTRTQSQHAVAALLRTVADNIDAVGVPRALTGPIMRGDAATVTAHRAALRESQPRAAAAYDAVAPLILQCAVETGLTSEQAQAIAQALERDVQRKTKTD